MNASPVPLHKLCPHLPKRIKLSYLVPARTYNVYDLEDEEAGVILTIGAGEVVKWRHPGPVMSHAVRRALYQAGKAKMEDGKLVPHQPEEN